MTRRPNPIDELGAKALAETIVRLREERGMSSLQLARAAEIAPATLENIEKRFNEPRWGTLRRIARALSMKLDELLAEAEALEEKMRRGMA
jgi:transcriptional regulator with XRE-family HTH domain